MEFPAAAILASHRLSTAARVCHVQAGGFVHDGRVNGTLNLSRALGDMEFKRGTELQPAEQVVSKSTTLCT